MLNQLLLEHHTLNSELAWKLRLVYQKQHPEKYQYQQQEHHICLLLFDVANCAFTNAFTVSGLSIGETVTSSFATSLG
jgi:hypothetical protein